jgi:hypothetical protein
MANEITESKIMQVLGWAYDKAVGGVPGFDSAEDLANSYLKIKGNRKDQVNALIRWQNTKAGTSGFITQGNRITVSVGNGRMLSY